MNIETNNTRYLYVDFASGIMILWMILFHAIAHVWSIYPCVKFPFLHFFMPWFFYKSGMFFHERNISDLWHKDMKKLIKPFILWSVAGALCFMVILWLNNNFTLRNFFGSILHEAFFLGKIPLNTPLWFLLTLFLVRFVANILLKLTGGGNFAMLISVVFLGYIVSYLAYRYNHHLLPYWVANGAAGMSFFILGYLFRNIEKCWWIILPCAIVYVIFSIVGFPMVDMFPNKLVNGHYLFWMPISLCCIVSYNAFCKFIYKFVRVSLVEWIGKNAMTILVIHVLLVKMTMELLRYNDVHLSPYSVLCMILLEYALILPLCCWIKQKYTSSN